MFLQRRLTPLRLFVLGAAALIIVASWLNIRAAAADVTTRYLNVAGIPARLLLPDTAAGDASADLPVMLIAHGFAGSQQLMLGYGLSAARAGYAALLWDFAGHGRNPQPLDPASVTTMQEDLAAIESVLAQQPEVDPGRMVLLGHSRGTAAVLRAALQQPGRYAAVIAISPTGTDWVAADGYDAATLPPLLLMAGQLEPPFAANAERWYTLAGADAAAVDRELLIVPNVEHITILFSPRAQGTATTFAARAFGVTPAAEYSDQRVLWYVAHLVTWLALLVAAAPLWRAPQPPQPAVGTLRAAAGLLVGGAAGVAAAVGVNQITQLGALGGIIIGGALGVYMLALGSVWLAATGLPDRPRRRDLLLGVALFAVLWLAFNWMAGSVWLPAGLIEPRLLRWPLLALAFVPALLAAAHVQHGAGVVRRALWWLALSAVLFIGLLLTLQFVPGLAFLALVLPLLPLIVGIMAVGAAAVGRPWAAAIGNALWFSWVVMAIFPLVA